MRETYDREAVQEILQIAIAKRNNDDEYTRSQLLDMSRELGITESDLAIAESLWLDRYGDRDVRREFQIYRETKFKRGLIRYGIVNGFLVLMNLVTSGKLDWSLLVLLGWGLALSLKAWKIYQPDRDDFETAFRTWQADRLTLDDWV